MINKQPFDNAAFDIENALSMFAYNYCAIPAESIYDKEQLAPIMEVIETCHIYLIGRTPIVEFIDAKQSDNILNLDFLIAEEQHALTYQLPDRLTLREKNGKLYLEDSDGRCSWPNAMEMQSMLSYQSGKVNFEVLYIGQAYGQDGSRNAVDRLLKHETLQKISLKGNPVGYRLSLLLLSIQPNNQLFMTINPFAKDQSQGSERIKAGIDKLFNTSEAECISLYEAALIRYFYPEFNKEFKDSFPSTNLKVLQDCYAKDFCSVSAEICIDGLPYRLYSKSVKPAWHHTAMHDLHKESGRKMFFGFA